MPDTFWTAAERVHFCEKMLDRGRELYRDLPWRRTRDPYAILLSEVMLQQTQVSRVLPRYERWLDVYPTIDALAAAPLSGVLQEWQGLGYNRRAVSLKRAAEQVAEHHRGRLPADEEALLALPGVGPATSAGILAFAFDQPATYLETNVRSVFLHEVFADADHVPDREILPLVSASVKEAISEGATPRDWYYALLDYGAWLKRNVPNPSRRSLHHVRQSSFEGSWRQKRALVLRTVTASRGTSPGVLAEHLRLEVSEVEALLDDLAGEGFLVSQGGTWRVAD